MSEHAERLKRWLDYEQDVHGRVVDSLRAVPEDRRNEPEYRKAVDLLAHIVAARNLWLFRFGVRESGPSTSAELFPEGEELAAVVRDLDAMHQTWRVYLETMDDRELSRTFRYRSIEGEEFENRIEDVLTQLFGHSWYHRGQIASLVRSLGAEPAVTDFVFWCRTPVG